MKLKKFQIRHLFETGLLNKKNVVRLFWCRCANNRNFGDVLGPYLVKRISGREVLFSNKYCIKEYYLTTGSILQWANKNAIVWGSGIISENVFIRKPKKILAVRGPKTRERLLELGFECPKMFGDPALLLPRIYQPKSHKCIKLGIIPHYEDYDKVKSMVKDYDLKIINVLDPIEKVIEDIFSCKKTISSSLHGIIVSHAYGIPSIWTKFSNKPAGDGFKFEDYFLSVNIEPYEPIDFSRGIPEEKYIIDFVDENNNNLPKINLNKFVNELVSVCPFKY